MLNKWVEPTPYSTAHPCVRLQGEAEMPKPYGMVEWAEHLKHVNRYHLTEDQWAFVGTAIEYVASHPNEINAATVLYRARKHALGQDSAYASLEMGAPPAYLQKGGRCSPPGIPCLYLASDPETAISEVRPWKKALISVAAFELSAPVKLADLRSVAQRPDFYSAAEKPRMTEKQRVLGQAAAMLVLEGSFARPGHEDNDLDYIPTQFVSGILKAEGFDGLIYSSFMRVSGYNVALFDPEVATVLSVDVYEIEDVNYWATKIGKEEGSDSASP
jgi:hypothetical protein